MLYIKADFNRDEDVLKVWTDDGQWTIGIL